MSQDHLVKGVNHPAFDGLRDMLTKNIVQGDEVGASIVVNIDGENVVDLWGGYFDENRTRSWERDTIVAVFSTTKTITSLAALMLIDRGIISPYEKVATYWPEFAANGKQDIEIRHIISHTSGVSGWDQDVTFDDIGDFDKAITLLEAQAPWWEPGTASGYHAFTHGFLIGKVMRNVVGKTMTEFIRDEIAKPLNADYQLGAVSSDFDRISPVVPYTKAPGADSNSGRSNLSLKTITNPKFTAGVANEAVWRETEMGGSNGFGNARGIAKILSAISLGGVVDGNRLLRQETIDLIFEEQSNGTDLVFNMPVRFGIGFGIRGEGGVLLPYVPEGKICFWTGHGGSAAIMDLDRKMTIAYAQNKLYPVGVGSNLTVDYVKEIYKAAEVYLK